MKLCLPLAACLVLVLGLGITAAEEALKSGPPIGQELPETFEPRNINGPNAGETTCIFCEYAERPVVMVFARELSEPLTRLIKRLDSATAKHSGAELASCVIFLSNDAALVKDLKQLAEKEKLQKTILRTYKPEGPKGYQLAGEADITVLLYLDRVVKASHAYRKGKWQEKEIDAVTADIAKILPAGK